MPLYGWSGPGKMRELSHERASAPDIDEPSDVPAADKTLVWVCGVQGCGKRFKKSMILARHFNTNHVDLKSDKDSWRAHAREEWV